MDYALQLSLIRFVKFCAVMAYAVGLGVALGPFPLPVRKQGSHLIASPALIVVWLCGYGLALLRDVPLTEFWIALGFVASLAAHLLMNRAARASSVSIHRRLAVCGLMGATLAVMVFRPTWTRLAP